MIRVYVIRSLTHIFLAQGGSNKIFWIISYNSLYGNLHSIQEQWMNRDPSCLILQSSSSSESCMNKGGPGTLSANRLAGNI
jgi:hypothetical protein